LTDFHKTSERYALESHYNHVFSVIVSKNMAEAQIFEVGATNVYLVQDHEMMDDIRSSINMKHL
jgi:hypothetical protein